MRNECLKKITLSLRSGVPNTSLAKAKLEDRALGQFSTRGEGDKTIVIKVKLITVT